MSSFLLRHSVFCLLFLTSLEATAQRSGHYLFSYFTGNGEDGLHFAYSVDGYTWKALNEGKSYLTPTAGRDKLMRDPSIIQGKDGLFHMVWTVSWGEQGIGYSSSKDLINWSKQQYLPVMEDARNCWAPELFYDETTKQYLIFWASTVPGAFPKGEEQRYNHRIFYITTEDFDTFSPTKLLYNHDFSVIDAAIVQDGSKYAMFLKDETDAPNVPEKNIRIATSDKAIGPYSPPGKPITGNYWAEGPSPLKINGKWFVYFDKYKEHKYGLITSTDLIHWVDESDKLVMPQGIRHGTAFEVLESVARKMLK